jgi:protein-tyrosine phosphatase
MKYIYYIIPNVLAGRPGPDEIRWNLDEIQKMGFKAVLSLHNYGDNITEIKENGFHHTLLDFPANDPPTEEGLKTIKRLLPEAIAFIGSRIERKLPVLVHCHAGRDRTGIVIGTYLVHKFHFSPEEALIKMREINPRILRANGFEELFINLNRESI